MDGEKTGHINQWLNPYAPSLERSHPGEERKLINISLGYEVLPLPGPRKIKHKRWPTNWGFRPISKEDFRTLLPFLCLWTMFTTETLGEKLGKEQKALYIMLLKWL